MERILGTVDWIPVPGSALPDGARPGWRGGRRVSSRRRASGPRELRLPLVWPDELSAPVPWALRAAAYAAEVGAGSSFALAAARMAFCGGYNLEDPRVLAEVAAASGIAIECLPRGSRRFAPRSETAW